jgi:hypothetical protein
MSTPEQREWEKAEQARVRGNRVRLVVILVFTIWGLWAVLRDGGFHALSNDDATDNTMNPYSTGNDR